MENCGKLSLRAAVKIIRNMHADIKSVHVYITECEREQYHNSTIHNLFLLLYVYYYVYCRDMHVCYDIIFL